MGSIRSKIIILILSSILTCAISIGAVSMLNINREEEYSSTRIINSVCRELSAELNHKIDTITLSVNSFASIAVEEAVDIDTFSDSSRMEDYMDTMQIMLRNIAENTENSLTYFLFVAPELIDPAAYPAGFLYTRPTTDDAFSPHELTDIFQFDRDDMAHVGWYYLPLDAGGPVWLEPYDNENLGLHMISYEVPLYLNGTFIGVVGMDLDFDSFTEPVRSLVIYETGYAYLMDDYGKVYCHPALAEGTVPNETDSNIESVMERFQGQDNGDELITYTSYAGIERKTAYSKLHNGMNVVISADSSAIYARRNTLFRTTLLIIAVVIAVWVAVSVMMARRITTPLEKLTQAAELISTGQLDVELPDDTRDEVGTLTRSFRVTTQYLRRYISDINTLAYRDPLTDVKNKTAYEEMVKSLQSQMDSGYRDFSIVMLDANRLKEINDRYGHAKGDEYLRNVCRMVCDVFKRSPVYRIGGDEFVVLLEKVDNDNRDHLMSVLEWRMKETSKNRSPIERLSVAAGLSTAAAGDRRVQEVFDRADKAMYRRKLEMKAGRR